MADSAKELHPSELSLFADPWESSGIQKQQFIDYRPTAHLTEGATITFAIAGNGAQYIDLKNTRLHTKVQIVKADGSPLDITEDSVAFANLPIHSLWKQVDVTLNQQVIGESTQLYPLKAYIETVLHSVCGPNYPQLKASLYVKDGTPEFDKPNNLEQNNPDTLEHSNPGLRERSMYTAGGRTADLEAPLRCDIAQQNRLILNSIDLGVKLTPAPYAYTLITPHKTEQYKVRIVDIYLRVLKVDVSPQIILAHNEILQNVPAKYPYFATSMKQFAATKGQYTVSMDDIYQGRVPTKLYVCFVSDETQTGSYNKNPFNLKHYNISSAAFYLNGLSVPDQPQQLDIEHFDIITAYNNLLRTAEKSDISEPFAITPKDFTDGYTILGFNIDSASTQSLEYWTRPKHGHTRLELKFKTPLPETINVILYATFCKTLYIDAVRNVTES